jgi:hypothetical protein
MGASQPPVQSPAASPWHASCRVPNVVQVSVDTCLDHLDEALHMLRAYNTPVEQAGVMNEQWHRLEQEILLPTEAFVPGSPHLHLAAWEALLGEGAAPGSDAAQVLSWVKDGYRLKFTKVDAPSQIAKPGHAEKIKVVRQILAQTVGRDQVDEYLSGDRPHQVYFANMRSASTHEQFVDDEVVKQKRLGVFITWPYDEPPQVISPIGVAVDRKGKRRLVHGLMYVNAFEEYDHFSYESLRDVEGYLVPSAFMYKSDFKAGYHHHSVHPDYWTYLCFAWKGEVLCCPFLPFGLQSACRTYTLTMKVVYDVLRAHGEEMTFLIDDRFGAAQEKAVAEFRSMTGALLLSALGFFFSLPKCELHPVQQCCFLGIDISTTTIDSRGRVFCQYKVPQDKMDYFIAKAHELLSTSNATPRMVSSVAGLLMSFKVAIPMAPLYVRGMYQVLQGVDSWDRILQLPQACRLDLEWWLQHAPRVNGCRMGKGLTAFQVDYTAVVDTSHYRHAARVTDPSGMALAPIVIDFPIETAEELGAAASTFREMRGIKESFFVLLEQSREAIQHHVLLNICDNQGCIDNFNRMGAGSPEMFQLVRQTYEAAMANDIELVFAWKPRTTPEVAMVDALTHELDPADFRFCARAFRQVCRKLLPTPVAAVVGRPTWGLDLGSVLGVTLDPLANSTNAKASTFFSQYFCPGTSGIDGYKQSWRVPGAGHSQLAWVFPGPVTCPALAIRKIKEERVDCILVVQQHWTGFWRGMLRNLPIADTVVLSYHQGLYEVGAAAPPSFLPAQHQPRVPLEAHLIIFQ